MNKIILDNIEALAAEVDSYADAEMAAQDLQVGDNVIIHYLSSNNIMKQQFQSVIYHTQDLQVGEGCNKCRVVM